MVTKKLLLPFAILFLTLGSLQAQDCFIGEIRMFGGNFAPRGWALCDGSLLSINQHQALFSILGTTYGGDGRTTFGLPDLRGRFPMHPGSGPGLSTRSLGQKGGTETNTLNTNQMPSHSHSATGVVRPLAVNGEPEESNPGGSFPASASMGTEQYAETPNTTMGESPVYVEISPTGNNQAVNNIPPFQCVNYIICLVGIYPSRN